MSDLKDIIPQPGSRIGTILAVADKENRGKTERRIHVQWERRRNRTWLALAAQGKRWRLAPGGPTT